MGGGCLTPLQRSSLCILQPQLTGQSTARVSDINVNSVPFGCLVREIHQSDPVRFFLFSYNYFQYWVAKFPNMTGNCCQFSQNV